MNSRRDKKRQRISNAFAQADYGDATILIVGLSIFFSLPWTLFRLARLSWHIESKQGYTDHHKRIVGLLMGYVIFWVFGIALACAGLWMLISRYGN